jgi:hypothetical protein
VTRLERFGNRYIWYPNCLDDAFATAARTLDDRISRNGASNPAVKDWAQGQDQVFANCTGGPDPWGPKQTYLPGAVPPDAPAWLRADREYQIAAGAFYAGNFEQARNQFQQIANRRDSPWYALAALLVARTLIRQATVTDDSGSPDPDHLRRADQELQAILSDSGLKSVHPSAQRLIEYVRLRLRPAQYFMSLATELEQATKQDHVAQKLQDFTFLLDKWQATGRLGGVALDELRSQSELTDWLITFQEQTPASLEHAVQRWSAGSKTAWLLAALSKASATHAQVAALGKASLQIKPGSKGFLTAAFHRIRLMIQTGDRTHARQELKSLLARENAASQMPLSAQNAFRALQLSAAASMDEFLSAAARSPAALSYEYQPAEDNPPRELMAGRYFDEDAAIALTGSFPLALLDRVTREPSLPPQMRRDVAIAAWTRAIVLGDEKMALGLSPLLTQLEPALRSDLDAFISASSPVERQFAAGFLLLRAPGMRTFVPSGFGRITWDRAQEGIDSIDNFRDNWWCQLDVPESGAPESSPDNWRHADRPNNGMSPALRILYPDGQIAPPSFLSPEQNREARRQRERLTRCPLPLFILAG